MFEHERITSYQDVKTIGKKSAIAPILSLIVAAILSNLATVDVIDLVECSVDILAVMGSFVAVGILAEFFVVAKLVVVFWYTWLDRYFCLSYTSQGGKVSRSKSLQPILVEIV